jgi:hypothetical protein
MDYFTNADALKDVPVAEMDRTQVIHALRIHAHPTWYHCLLAWSTPRLKALLLFYRESEAESQETIHWLFNNYPHDVPLGRLAD